MDARRWFWSILLLGVLATVGINWYLDVRSGIQDETPLDALVPDIILNNTSQMNFGDDGTRHYRVDAREALHYRQRGLTEFLGPDLLFFQQDARSWDVTAARGLTPDNGVTFQLTGNVVIRQIKAGQKTVELQTESLDISTETEIAHTDQPVLIMQGPNRTESEGLHVNMQTGKLTLPKRVTSRYLPPST
jgi:LPS export ABC transporter protein LptC